MKKIKKMLSLILAVVFVFSVSGMNATALGSLFGDPNFGDPYYGTPIYADETDITVLAPSLDRAPYSSGEVQLSNGAIIVTNVVWGEAAPGDSSFRWMSYGESFKEGYEYRVAISYGMNPSSISTTYDHTITVNGSTPTNIINDNAVYGTVYQDFDNLMVSGGGFFDFIFSILGMPFRILLLPFYLIFGF